MREMRELVQIKCSDLADLIFILTDQACEYHGVDQEELTVEQFTSWLGEQKGTVTLRESIPREENK